MMLAAADYAESTGKPPPELAIALQCRRWNTLPREGGLLDQPAGLMRKMSIAENVYNAFRGESEHMDDIAKWVQENPQAHELTEKIRKMRKEVNNGC